VRILPPNRVRIQGKLVGPVQEVLSALIGRFDEHVDLWPHEGPKLMEDDEIEATLRANGAFQHWRRPKPASVRLQGIRASQKTLPPADWKFDRDEANSRESGGPATFAPLVNDFAKEKNVTPGEVEAIHHDPQSPVA